MGESANRVRRVVEAVRATVPSAAGARVAPSWCPADMQPIRNPMLGVGAQPVADKSPASATVVELHEQMVSREATYCLHDAVGEHVCVLFRFALGPVATPHAGFEGLDAEAALTPMENWDGAIKGYPKPRALDVVEAFLIRFLSKGARR